VHVVQVYLVAEYDNYQALGLTAGLHPIPLFEAQGSPPTPWQVSRVTWPHRDRYTYAIPLRKLAGRGLSAPGVLRGQAHIVVTYPSSGFFWKRSQSGPVQLCVQKATVPFSITLTRPR
jgi:hypothetical protein